MDLQSTEEWQIANEENNKSLITYWENRYKTGGNSGNGSYNQEAVMKATIINHWIKEYDIKTINEIGCGDANNLLMYTVPIAYSGYDISPKAIEICNQKTRKIRNSLMYYFTSEYNKQDFDANLLLCLDVWFHQVLDEDFEKLCKNIFTDFRGKYVIIYSTDSNSQFTQDGLPLSPHCRNREVLSEIQKYPQWRVLYWLSGIEVNHDGKVTNEQFPGLKRFYLLERIPLDVNKV